MGKYKQGKYVCVNPQKYIGDSSDIVYRSSWEQRMCKWCDSRENVIEWSSETIVVPYYFPVDNKNHRYFVDFLVKIRSNDNTVKTLLIEIKPSKEVNKPTPPKTNNRKAQMRYSKEIETYIKNQCKWEAASAYAAARGYEFVVLTEHHLYPRKGKR
jgi:hypothetical protein